MNLDLNRLRQIFSSALTSDCLDFLGHRNQILNSNIRMISGQGVMVEWTSPVRLEIADVAPEVPYVGLLAALDAVRKDQVYVIASHRLGRAALWGELLATAYSLKGVAGALADGPICDIAKERINPNAAFAKFGVL